MFQAIQPIVALSMGASVAGAVAGEGVTMALGTGDFYRTVPPPASVPQVRRPRTAIAVDAHEILSEKEARDSNGVWVSLLVRQNISTAIPVRTEDYLHTQQGWLNRIFDDDGSEWTVWYFGDEGRYLGGPRIDHVDHVHLHPGLALLGMLPFHINVAGEPEIVQETHGHPVLIVDRLPLSLSPESLSSRLTVGLDLRHQRRSGALSDAQEFTFRASGFPSVERASGFESYLRRHAIVPGGYLQLRQEVQADGTVDLFIFPDSERYFPDPELSSLARIRYTIQMAERRPPPIFQTRVEIVTSMEYRFREYRRLMAIFGRH